ncbi:MAG: gliding motility-associated C-terminal domain-containing protein [Crocinitomicaceae bacterium]|nr:gliding motility-associated C-terminal domain-containing protein [Crocinitomicaceae bacterium]
MTTYYLVIDGDNAGAGVTSAAECTFDIVISGPGIDRPNPTATIAESSTNVCLNEIVTFTPILTNCPDNGDYLWSINGTLAATTVDPIFQTTKLQNGDVVSVKTSCFTNCIDTVTGVSQAINVYTIALDAGSDQSIQQGKTTTLSGSTTAPVYSWAPEFLLSSPSILNPVALPTETTTYSLTAEENGCTLTDYVTITIFSTSLEVPNTFSPNGDTKNDTWVIEGIEKYPDNQIMVFDRWGQKVYHGTGYSAAKAWDGSLTRGDVTESVYFYVIELNNENGTIIHGSLTILR